MNTTATPGISWITSRRCGTVAKRPPQNLALACFLCNRYKGSDVAAFDPSTGDVVRLFDPRRQQWNDHFTLQGALIVPLTATGRATAALLRLNAPERVIERRELLRVGRYPPA